MYDFDAFAQIVFCSILVSSCMIRVCALESMVKSKYPLYLSCFSVGACKLVGMWSNSVWLHGSQGCCVKVLGGCHVDGTVVAL